MKDQQSQGRFEQHKRDAAASAASSTNAGSTWSGSQQSHDRVSNDLRRDLNYERMQNRQLRQDNFYANYSGRQNPFTRTTFSDPFGNIFFWLWLSDRPQHQRDEWVYHHRDEIDPARYGELRQRDRDLDRRLAELERSGVKRDPSYTPPEFKDNQDLIYGDDVVEGAYKKANKSSFPWFWTIGLFALVGAVGYIVITRVRMIRT